VKIHIHKGKWLEMVSVFKQHALSSYDTLHLSWLKNLKEKELWESSALRPNHLQYLSNALFLD
jgi:hypothetical protein